VNGPDDVYVERRGRIERALGIVTEKWRAVHLIGWLALLGDDQASPRRWRHGLSPCRALQPGQLSPLQASSRVTAVTCAK
jgi:hypothetical protein